ncbi:MAG: Trk family potassium uptake protein [Clostridia bacterium]|nr:Trk family potassium uptake protein [Clostridia bacterium]
MIPKRRKRLSTFQVIILGFLAVLLIGALLLMLPFATKGEESASFIDALFTSTSALCVTGLVVQSTAAYWSVFGQVVILILIQIGGLGVITIAMALATLAGRKIGLMQRMTMQEAISAPEIGGIEEMTKFILKISFSIELIGTLLFMPTFCSQFGFGKGLYYSVFHSISAFCNAGFDLMGTDANPFPSLTGYTDNALVSGTAILLIVVGGIGFATWKDISKHGLRFRRYRMQSKVALTVSALLIVLPTVYFFFFEVTDGNVGERILASLFMAVSPRTAGFNTSNLNEVSEVGNALTILLMLIGGTSGSTAGGIKTTTVAVLIASVVAVFRRKSDTALFGRRIVSETVRHATVIFLMYFTLFFVGGSAIAMIEGLPLLDCLYEAASAIATVGLTLGITPSLGIASRLILIVLMFLGRVGGLTLIFAALSGKPSNNSAHLPREKITVG